jgi:hypothetical protein
LKEREGFSTWIPARSWNSRSSRQVPWNFKRL